MVFISDLKFKILLSSLLLFFFYSCREAVDEDDEDLARREHFEEVIEVRTKPVERGVFNMELMSNGRLSAVNKATVRFRVHEMIREVNVINGERVEKGELLGVLEEFPFASRLDKAGYQLQQARLDLQDRLLDHGYYLDDSLSVPDHIWEMAKIRSGYNRAENEMAEARYEMEGTRLKAPINGVVSGLEAKPNNHSSKYEQFCIIVDNSRLEVNFPVLESEMSMITTGQPVEVRPFANRDQYYSGRVTGYDPRVDDDGMVMVTALIDNPRENLLHGMNVQVFLKKEVPGQLVIPREALVLRQGRQVVFTLQDSIAMWNYVEVGYENSREFAITDGLEEGQEVIVSGNFNLAHETRVKRVD